MVSQQSMFTKHHIFLYEMAQIHPKMGQDRTKTAPDLPKTRREDLDFANAEFDSDDPRIIVYSISPEEWARVDA